jgi:hypothetical protein
MCCLVRRIVHLMGAVVKDYCCNGGIIISRENRRSLEKTRVKKFPRNMVPPSSG